MGLSIKAGVDVLIKAAAASWFEWSGGSTLVFWRWSCFQREARDSFKVWITEDNLRKKAKRLSPTVPPELPHIRKLFLEKVVRIMLVKCIEGGFVR